MTPPNIPLQFKYVQMLKDSSENLSKTESLGIYLANKYLALDGFTLASALPTYQLESFKAVAPSKYDILQADPDGVVQQDRKEAAYRSYRM